MWGFFFCDSDDDRTLTSCSPVRTRYQTTQRHMPRDGSCTNPTGCCPCVHVVSCRSLYHNDQQTVPTTFEHCVHGERSYRGVMTSCRRVSGMWVQAFRSHILSPSPVFDIGNLIKILARLWMSCPKGRTAVRLVSSTVLWISLHPSRERGPLPFVQMQNKREEADIQCLVKSSVFWLMYSLCSLSVSVATQCNCN